MALTKIDDRGLKTPIDLLDNEKIRLGTGNDLELYHDGTDNFITTSNGHLNIYGDGTNEIYIRGLYNEDSIVIAPNGGVELYYDNVKKLNTNPGGIKVIGNIACDGDNQKLILGANDDFQLYHNGSYSIIDHGGPGDLYIESQNNFELHVANGEDALKATANGAVELYHDNSKKLWTTSNGAEFDGYLTGNDNDTIQLGNAGDLQIYHNGSTSIIDSTTSNLDIQSNNTINIKAADESSIVAHANGAVELYYDNTTRVSTATNGFTVRGKSFIARENGGIGDYTNVRLGFYQSIGASSSHTFQVGSLYAIGTVTIWGSRGAGANNATVATGKIYPIHIRATATAGLGSQIGSDIGGANGGFSYSVAAGGQGITVHNTDNTYAMNTFVTFDLTGFVG